MQHSVPEQSALLYHIRSTEVYMRSHCHSAALDLHTPTQSSNQAFHIRICQHSSHNDSHPVYSRTECRLVRLYDSRAGPSNCMTLRGHRDNVRDLCIAADAQRLVSASSDKCVRTWDLRAPGRCVAGLRLHDDAAWALAAADKKLDHVYTGGRDGKVCCLAIMTKSDEVPRFS